MSVSAQELKLRIKVVNLALQLLKNKEHYYWGAPDTGTVPVRQDDFSPEIMTRHILAASQDGLHFCAGRCNSSDVLLRVHFSGSTPVDVRNAHPERLSFPRYYRDGDTVHPSKSERVWGESCVGKKHFDCGSFVRYCFRTVLGPSLVRPGIQMHDLAKAIWPSTGSDRSPGNADVLPADIVYSGRSHVGLTTGKATYLSGEGTAAGIPADKTVHAFYAKMGVVMTDISGSDPRWTEIRRWEKWS